MRKKLLRSRSGFEKPESREEAIMQNILGASNVLEPSESNIEEILKSILYNTPYTKEAEFEIEKILLAIKNNGTYDGEGESRDTKILIAILNDLDYTEEAESRIEELFIEWLHQRSSIKVLEGIPPLTFTSRGLPLINYLIEGNTVQTGTPTPDSPVMPQGTGERTGNLLDIKDGTETINNVVWTANHGSITAHGTTTAASSSDGIIVYGGTFTRSGNYINYCKIQASKSIKPPAGTYTFSANANPSDSSRIALIVGDDDTYFANQTARKIAVGETFSVNGNEYVMLVVSSYTALNQYNFADIMLNLGSTALPYEPYGIKIQISSASITTPIYLGEVQTTRNIQKQILTGTESVLYNGKSTSNRIMVVTLPTNEIGTTTPSNVICTHFETKNTTSQTSYGGIAMRSNGIDFVIGIGYDIINVDSDSTNVEVQNAFKAYLADQYAAGTPVTVWYVLATEETAVVNEPLMKIGDYADTLSKEQANVEIPTASGSNTLDVDTTVKPSNIYIEYK